MMQFMLAILYYAVVIVSLLFFFFLFKKFKMELLSFSVISYLCTFFLAILPGYFIATGDVFLVLQPHLYRGFDITIYFIYLLLAMLMPAGLLLGRLIANRYEFTIPGRCILVPKIFVISISVIVYTFLYYAWLPVIPINEAIMGTMKGLSLVVARLEVTHQLGCTGYTVPRLFGYWRPMLQPISIAIFIFWIQYLNLKKPLNFIMILLGFTFVLYGQIFTLEKAPVIYFIMALIISLCLIRKIRFFKAFVFVSILAVFCMLFMYYYFMQVGIQDLIRSFVHRAMSGTASIYDQILYVKNSGLLFISNMHMNYVNENPIDVSIWSFYRLNTKAAAVGAIGTSGGLSLAELYFSFSYFGAIVYFIMVTFYGFFDGFLLSLYSYEKDTATKNIHLGIYAVFCTLYMAVLMNNVFYIFEFPTIVSRYFYPVVFIYIILFKLESIKIRNKVK